MPREKLLVFSLEHLFLNNKYFKFSGSSFRPFRFGRFVRHALSFRVALAFRQWRRMRSGRSCHVCGAPYVGGTVCSRPECPRNGATRRSLGVFGPRGVGTDVEPEPEAEAERTLEQAIAELVQHLVAAAQVAAEVVRAHGPRALQTEEVETALERLIRILGRRLRRH